MLRWSLFAAVTRRPMNFDLRWHDYFDIADTEMSYRERLRAYATIAAERYDTERFEEFCAVQLPDLDDIALEYLGTDRALEAVEAKVAAVFPADEVGRFTEHFWGLLQFWRKTESDRLQAG